MSRAGRAHIGPSAQGTLSRGCHPGRMTTRWTDADVPDQHGRVALVTGANTGIGYEAATVLAERGATVVLACRDHVKVVQAVRRIRQRTPQATVETLSLDLASMASIRHAALELHRRHPRLDLLINNAGLMMPPYGLTKDGFELQIGVNHLGHFALTGLLLDRLLTTSGSRVVTVGSITHKRGVIDFDDLHFHKRRYGRMTAYSQSKLANLLFSHELHRRLEATGADTIAVAAHPGTARTELRAHQQRRRTRGHEPTDEGVSVLARPGRLDGCPAHPACRRRPGCARG